MSTFSKTSTFLRCPTISQSFSPLGYVGFCLRAWPQGRGSRGKTPLLLAAQEGHVGVLQQLIEAKAAVDVQNNDGRGLGTRNLRGKNF